MNFSIREATTDDPPLIHQLASQIWEPTYGHILEKEQLNYMFEMMYAHANIAKQMNELKHQFFIVSIDDEPVGYLSIETISSTLYIVQKIYTLPSVQGKGIGRFTLNAGIAYLRGLCDKPFKVQLYVNRENKALGFYQHVGFRIIDTRDFHIGNNYYMNDYIMELDVE